ncbi:hypothetical protein HDU79_000804, partial [Rhizoclosmatium sp. JEL0117]
MLDREGHELRQAMISIRSAIPAATWDPVRELNEGIVDEGYHQFHMTSFEPAHEETSEDDGMDLDLSSPDEKPIFQFTPELASTMFKNMKSTSTRGSSYFSADVVFTTPFESRKRKWYFKLMLEDPILYDRFTNAKPKLNIELQYQARASESTSANVVDSAVFLDLFEAFGSSVDTFEPAKVITQLKQFLVLCAKTVWLSEYTEFIYAIDKRGSSFEKSVGYRELLLREDIGFDGYECFDANFINVDRDRMFDQMEELLDGVQIEVGGWRWQIIRQSGFNVQIATQMERELIEMEQDPTLVWQLVVPAINYISDIARLSQTCQALHAICAREMRFSTALFETIDQDLNSLKDKGPIGWAQTDNGTTWFSYLNHVQTAITAAYETHKLHASPATPFLKLCRYTLFTDTLLRNEHRVNGQMTSVVIRLPSTVPELAGGLLFIDCHTFGGYSTHVSCYIPRSKTAGTPTNDLAYGADVPFDPCQRALQTLFRGCPLLYNNLATDKQMFATVFTTGNGVERQFAAVFESLIRKYNYDRPFTMKDLLSTLFKGIDFGHTHTASIPPKSWRPLFYPSVSFLYEHPLAKSAFLTRFDLAKKLERRIKSLMKIPIFLALFDSAFSWDPEESDCNSEMSEDYEFLTDDEEDNLLEEVSDFMPLERLETDFAVLAGQGSMRDREGHELRQAMISIRSAIPEATWDPIRELNEGIVDEGYHQFHMTSFEPAYEETSEDDGMDLDL